MTHLMENLSPPFLRGDLGRLDGVWEECVFFFEKRELRTFMTPTKLNLGNEKPRDFFLRDEKAGRSVT
ncbi:hypothetical protein [Candidatus Paracaedibacter symbiosus]|uniref:hypothetical protein n=1 Tax=Candidatus Paracaedibacter symbiosus TaxID=244582 RepID=UPI0012EB6166|nr:hypothetical protein [Candidatus Paracaedibacter symbiosus]